MDRGLILAQIERMALGTIERSVVPLGMDAPAESARAAFDALLAQRKDKTTKKGAHNQILCPPGEDYIVRVAMVEEEPAVCAQEMRLAVAAWDLGVGLPLLWCGLLRIDGLVVSASCWPACSCALAYARGLMDGEHAKFGRRLLAVLDTSAGGMLLIDGSLRNALVTPERLVLIDFDPYFTKRAENEAQRAAALGFVGVSALLIECTMRKGMFALGQLAERVGCCAEIDAVASALGAICEACCAAFEDVGPVIMRIAQTYGVHGAGTRVGKRDARVKRINAVLDAVADDGPFVRIAHAGNTGLYLAMLMRVALSAAFDEQVLFDVRVARFLVEYDGYVHFFARPRGRT